MKQEVPSGYAVVSDTLVPAAGHFAHELRHDDVLRIVNVEGEQVADLVLFNLKRLQEKLSPPNSLLLNKGIFPGAGYGLFSDEANLMMTIVADTSNGVHDMIAGACSSFTNEVRYQQKNTHNCRDNFASAGAPWGLSWKDMPYPMNVFMNCPIGDKGTFGIEKPVVKAGEYIEFKAEMDLLAIFSNCPQTRNPCNNFKIKPLQAVVYRRK
jgi:uncharacterized protein YcgI (DUF1989 family)